MTEYRHDAGDANARAVEVPGERTCESTPLVELLATIRTEDAPDPSAMPMVIRAVEPAIRTFIQFRVTRAGFDHSFAEDVLQDALLLITLRAHQCRATSVRSAMSWMRSVARSAITEAMRREGPPRSSLDGQRSAGAAVQSFDESIGRRPECTAGMETMLRLTVDASLALSPQDATLLWMRLIAEEEWSDIGLALGISATAARRRFQRAQRSMRRRVQHELSSLPPGAHAAARDWLRTRLQEEVDVEKDDRAQCSGD